MDVNDLLTFVKVAEAGSFSKAARLLSMPVSTVSRRVAELEEELGVTLLQRTTRSLKITDVGSVYLQHGRTIAGEIEAAEAVVTHLQSVPQGILKITAPPDFGNFFLGKVVSEYSAAHPKVKVDLVLTERVVDLISEGFDLAIRIGELEDSTLLSRKIGTADMQMYASPAYLKRKGTPKTCAELTQFDCIHFTGEDESRFWNLTGPSGEVQVEVNAKLSSNNMSLIREFALAGEGIAMIPHFLCVEDLKAGALKMVLKDWAYVSGPIHVVFPGQRFLLPKVRAFMEHLVRHCNHVQWRYRPE